MNNLGFSIDNLHIGDVRIKGQGETLRVGDDNGGDGYILPTIKGTEGQVLTMNPDNTTTSFQDINIPDLTGKRVCINRWYSMNQSGKAGTGQGTILYNVTDGPLTSLLGRFTTGNNVIPASDLSETENNFTTMYLQIRNIVDNVDPLQANINTLILVITTGGVTSQIEFELMDYTGLNTSPLSIETAVEHYISIARLPTQPSNIYISIKGVKATNQVSTTLPNDSNGDKPFHSHNQFKLGSETGNLQQVAGAGAYSTGCVLTNYVNGDDITIDIQATRGGGTPNTIITNLVMGRMDTYVLQQLPSGGPVTNDHLLLTNLNGGSGDGGHINLYDRRGVKPMTGDVDMNGNEIKNVVSVTNSGPLALSESVKANTIILDRDISNGVYLEANPAQDITLNAGGGTNLFKVRASDVLMGSNLDMNSNDITNANIILGGNAGIQMTPNLGIGTTAGDVFLTSAGKLTVSSVGETLIRNTTDNSQLRFKTGVSGGLSTDGIPLVLSSTDIINIIRVAGGELIVGGSSVDIQNVNLNMNDNEIVDCNNIRTNIQPIFTINKNGSNATEIYGNSTIRRIQVSNAVYLLTGTNLECGTNDINDCGNLNVVSINNLTPVGGLSSGTSNSALLTASTAEQSILASTFVGSRQAPANSFKVGDAYTATLAGEFSSNNGDTLTLRLKGGATGTTVLSSLVVPLNGSSSVFYELEINFIVRAIGGAGVADLAINYDFSYNQASGGNFQGERKCEVNNTTFDTTILNSLDITAQFNSLNAGNSIETLLSTLGKNY